MDLIQFLKKKKIGAAGSTTSAEKRVADEKFVDI